MRHRARGTYAGLAVVALAAFLSSACGGNTSNETQPAATTIGAPRPAQSPADVLRLPKKAGSIRFAAIGDAGRGNPPQYEVSAQMQAYRRLFPFDFVIMLGDNVYDGGTPEDYRRKFEEPYKPLLDAGVKFYATIGNHDDPNQASYEPFHMEGHRYHTFTAASLVSKAMGHSVRFFAIDTEQLDRAQLAWLDREMEKSDAEWNIPFFHRPIYSSGRYERPASQLRPLLEPVFLRHGVSVAFSGHEHFYERVKPQRGITYFISGGAGSLRVGDIRPSEITDVGFDRDYHFMLIEIAGDELYYQAIARSGASIDSGIVRRPRAHIEQHHPES
jgi:hypothetical protein